ncbi:MAG: GTPase HflX [Bacteroidota bacterium]|nr:GTPase HflX [Bacteroidota bacterium]
MKNKERAILVGVALKSESQEKMSEYLDELEFLTLTAGAKVYKKFIQNLPRPNNKTFVGSGKLKEIIEFIKEENIDIVVFEDELSPTQLKNIEKALSCKILDRTNLILDIFANRAKTAQARTQVELAQYQYLMPRLAHMWTHLERQKGGIGLRGPGEREIETDRRIVRNKITLLKKKLQKIDKQNAVRRKSRGQKIRVSIVGYTNAGKSTIMNILSKADVFAENKLFATLDTTVRNVVIKNVTFLLSDTVGFIRKLPHRLVESFKSTLDETREADILLHVVDLSHSDYENQLKTVNNTLSELNALDKPILVIFNKVDKLSKDFLDVEDYKNANIQKKINLLNKSYIAKDNTPCIFISAIKNVNIDLLKNKLIEMVKESYVKVYPHHPISITH